MYFFQNYAGCGWSLILWSMLLYMEGWSSASSYLIGVALATTTEKNTSANIIK